MTSTNDLMGSRIRWSGRSPKRMAAGWVGIELDCTTKLIACNRRKTWLKVARIGRSIDGWLRPDAWLARLRGVRHQSLFPYPLKVS